MHVKSQIRIRREIAEEGINTIPPAEDKSNFHLLVQDPL